MELVKRQGPAAGELENLNSCVDALDVSEKTRRDYKASLKLFYSFIEGNGLNLDSFLDYKRELERRQDISISTKNAYLTAARVILKEANKRGALPADITANVKSFKQNKKHKRPGLDSAEVKAVLQAAETSGDARERALLSLLTFQGLRQIEIARLDITDIDLSAGLAHVQGKGQHDRELIYLHPETARALQEYMDQEGRKSGPLFISRDRARAGHRLTTRAIREIIRRRLAALGIKKVVHGFRHYFTTRLLEEFSGDLLQVAAYTRHASIETLQIYDDRRLQAAELPKYYGAFSSLKGQASAKVN